MKLDWLKASVLVAAREHNPTILHPAFLTAQGIVPAEWELAKDPVCTPAFAAVSYRNRVTLVVEGSRFQVSEAGLRGLPEQSPVAGLASAYLSKLPHVRYTEVEIRFQAFVPHDDPATFLIGRFLKGGPWNASPQKLDAMGLRLEYSVDRALLDLFLDPGSIMQDGVDRTGVIVGGSYSSELPEANPLPQAQALLSLWPERCHHFVSAVNIAVRLGD